MTPARSSRVRFALAAAALLLPLGVQAQVVPASTHGSGAVAARGSDTPDPVHTGWSASLVSSAAHDATSGWSMVETPAIGVRFNRILSADASLPYYAYVNTLKTDKTGTTTVVSRHGVVGDAAVAAHATFDPGFLSDTLTAAFTAPTGDQKLGLGAGHLGYNLNNHLEHNVAIFTPDLELGVGNTSTLLRRKVRKAYTSYGLLGFLQAGSSVDLPAKLSLDAEAYEQLPLGTQVVYSRGNRKASKAAGRGRGGKGTLLTQTSDGEDNGVTLELDTPPIHRVSFGASYSRSIRLDDTTLGLAMTLVLHAPGGR